MLLERRIIQIRLFFRHLFHSSQKEHELDEEIQFHINQQFELNCAAGMNPQEARRAAQQAFGYVEARKAFCRDHWLVSTWDKLRHDACLALRRLARERTFSISMFLLLALGIGAHLAVFSVFSGVLLNPLPFTESDRLVIIRETIPERDADSRAVNALHFGEWTACDCLTDLALAEWTARSTLLGKGDPARLPYLRVTPNLFGLLGVTAQLGRTLIPEDAQPGGETNILISDRLWRSTFGAAPDVVGESVSLDSLPYTIVGVLPPNFQLYGYASDDATIDIFSPWTLERQPWWQWTNNYSYTAFGRLSPGVSRVAATAELNAIQAAIARDHFSADTRNLSLKVVVVPILDWVTRHSRDGLYLMLAAVTAAFLVVCLNIANLTLVRAEARSREAGVRSALGATRLSILRGIVIENAFVCIAGALAGIAIAWAALAFLTSFAATDIPRLSDVKLEKRVLLGAIALAIAATTMFSLLPALKLTQIDPKRALDTGSRGMTASAKEIWSRKILVVAEVGLSVVLLIVAGLLLASFIRLNGVDRGFDSTNVTTADVGLPLQAYPDNETRVQFWNDLRSNLLETAGVSHAGFSSIVPLRGNFFGSTAIREGEQLAAEEQPAVQYRFVSEGYLGTIGTPVLRGRDFVVDDYGRNAAVISLSTAELLWGDEDPLGRRFHWNDPENPFEVIGVVPDVPSSSLEAEPDPIVYRPLSGTGDGFQVMSFATVAIRMTNDLTAAGTMIQRAVSSIDPDLAISRIETMRQIEDAAVGDRRFQLYLVAGFSTASLLIAALGIYSVLAYVVSLKHHELAVRMALGANRRNVFSFVLAQGMLPVAIGVSAGLAIALALGRILSGYLFAVAPNDPATIGAVLGVVSLVAVIATVHPALQATRTRALALLRYG